jgi:hypothetical protein
VDASTSRLYAIHTDGFYNTAALSPWCHLTLQRPLWGTKLLFWLCTVAFIYYNRRTPTFIPQFLKNGLVDRLRLLPSRERAYIRGSASGRVPLSLHAIDRSIIIVCTSQTELNLLNQLVGVSGTALVNRLIVRISDRRESDCRESYRHESHRC